MDTFDGDWEWRPSGLERLLGARTYGVRIRGCVGICTRTNAPQHFRVGDVTLKIETATGNTFFGKEIFTNGIWYDVSATLEGDTLIAIGGGGRWKLVRRDATR